MEFADGTVGRPTTYCSDGFSWKGNDQPNGIVKEVPTESNITCKKCLENLKWINEKNL
jgi:hypothetical protein